MLTFQPKPGSVVYCDYRGFVLPEMVKKRPVIVVSKHRQNSKLLAVVPISSTPPTNPTDYHVEMDVQFCSAHLSIQKCWVKCDMINVVSTDRLNLVRDKKSGIRHAPDVGIIFLDRIKEGIRKAHGL